MLGFTIGLRTLSAAQQAMDVIGQNVSNAGTPGYSRRLTLFGTTDPMISGRFSLGTGVYVSDIRRVHDDLLESRLREQHQALGQLDASGSLLKSLEGFFQEPSDSGLAARLDELWSSFSSLTNSPGDVSARDGLVQTASTLAAGFRQIASQVGSVGNEARASAASAVDEVNGLVSELASVNARIVKTRAFGSTPSDLLDSQQTLLLALSDWVDPQTIARNDGTVDVLVDGMLVVSGDSASRLETVFPSDGSIDVRLADTKQSLALNGGRLKGYLDLARSKVPSRLGDLDKIARELMLQVNRIHTTGVSGQGPYTNLVAAVAVGQRNGGAGAVNLPLDSVDLPFDVVNGRLTVNVIEAATGKVEQHFIDIDPSRMSLADLTAQLDGLAHVTASLDSVGRLRVASESGFGFDFSPRLDPNPDDAGSFGSDTATISSAAGPFALNQGDTLSLDVNGSGPQTVTFQATDFADITHATADEVAAVLNAQVAGLNASAQGGRLVLKSNVAGAAGSLQVTGSSNNALLAAGSVDVGNDQPVAVAFSGAPTDGRAGHFTVRAKADGIVGMTPGLTVEVLDDSGTSLGVFDVGSGYTPGDKIEILPGVSMTLSAGAVEQSHGDAFDFNLVQNSDSSDVLSALQLGAFFTGTGAADLEVASEIVADPRRMAGSRNGDAGDGSNFFALVGLKDQGLADLGGRTFAQTYGDVVAGVGLDVRTNQTANEAQNLLLTSLESKREEISGVNQDEEMLKLVEYQHLYQAAGKYLQTVSENMQTLFDIL